MPILFPLIPDMIRWVVAVALHRLPSAAKSKGFWREGLHTARNERIPVKEV